MAYHLTRQQLYNDLHEAYLCARRHKRKKAYQQRFEANLYWELQSLCDELWSRTYKARPSEAFLIHDPKIREVFAANFRDRVVHHLYFNYVHEMLERTFIQDSYSCIRNRGTHYGIARLQGYIRSESRNYTRRCYVLKMDISGYFMHINRASLLSITQASLHIMASHKISKDAQETWADIIDMDFVDYLSGEIILLDPTDGAIVKGRRAEWRQLPKSKSLYCSPKGCGLPIGNLTSQLFSNVYLNVLDQWMKREMRCHAYGRYVDDFYVVSADRGLLVRLIPQITAFLKRNLGLTVQTCKTQICDVNYGVEFLGGTIKPHRTYVSRPCVRRMRRHLRVLQEKAETMPLGLAAPMVVNSLNSFLGVLGHYQSYQIRRRLFDFGYNFGLYGEFNKSLTLFQ